MAKFHRIKRLNLRQGMQGILTETANSSVTGSFAIPSVFFFHNSHVFIFILDAAESGSPASAACVNDDPDVNMHLMSESKNE